MAEAACRLARARGGSLLVATGPRTAPDVADAFFAGIEVPSYRYAWHSDDGTDNPSRAYLALCDEFIVSGDSECMMQAEAIPTGRPVHVFPLATPAKSRSRLGHRLEASCMGARARPAPAAPIASRTGKVGCTIAPSAWAWCLHRATPSACTMCSPCAIWLRMSAMDRAIHRTLPRHAVSASQSPTR
ncbi:hypothetical protein GG670_29145 [Pseudomonas aeruginosa]|nr:hypothetical protein [Pseudomonas aeruginosa]